MGDLGEMEQVPAVSFPALASNLERCSGRQCGESRMGLTSAKAHSRSAQPGLVARLLTCNRYWFRARVCVALCQNRCRKQAMLIPRKGRRHTRSSRQLGQTADFDSRRLYFALPWTNSRYNCQLTFRRGLRSASTSLRRRYLTSPVTATDAGSCDQLLATCEGEVPYLLRGSSLTCPVSYR